MILRPFEEWDVEHLIVLQRDYRSWAWRNRPRGTFQSTNNPKKWWNEGLSSLERESYFAAIDPKLGFVGVVQLDALERLHGHVRMGIDVLAQYRRQGWGVKICRKAEEVAFGRLGVNRIWAKIPEMNKAAQGLFRKCGWKKEGKLREAFFEDGKYYDEILMSMLKNEKQALVAFDEVMDAMLQAPPFKKRGGRPREGQSRGRSSTRRSLSSR